MISEKTSSEIKHKIASNQTSEAIEILLGLMVSEKAKDIIRVFQSEYKNIEMEELKGIITRENAIIEKNKVNYRIFEFLRFFNRGESFMTPKDLIREKALQIKSEEKRNTLIRNLYAADNFEAIEKSEQFVEDLFSRMKTDVLDLKLNTGIQINFFEDFSGPNFWKKCINWKNGTSVLEWKRPLRNSLDNSVLTAFFFDKPFDCFNRQNYFFPGDHPELMLSLELKFSLDSNLDLILVSDSTLFNKAKDLVDYILQYVLDNY